MLESLFQYPTVFARRCEGPAADERQRFLLQAAQLVVRVNVGNKGRRPCSL